MRRILPLLIVIVISAVTVWLAYAFADHIPVCKQDSYLTPKAGIVDCERSK